MRCFIGFLFFLFSFLTASAQSTAKSDAPKIFIDCQTRCFYSYLKQELTYVNHMLDRQTADVFIQITSQDTGSGGDQYQVELIGKDRFVNHNDTLIFNLEPNISDNEQRETLLKNIEKGLIPYLMQTSVSKDISFEINKKEASDTDEVINDPWNSWVFNISGYGNINGQETYQSLYLNGRISASKVTDEVKIEPRIYFNYDRSTFSFEDEEDDVFVITNSGGSLKYVKSITDHWSTGFFSELSESSFSNYDFSASFQPALEYNYYPYQESNKKQLTALYRIGPQYNDYVDSTIFELNKELLFRHSIELSLRKIENWGNLDIDFTYGNYLHDWDLLFASVQPYIELNVFKGLSFNVGGSFSWIRNQVNIPKGDASRDDVLLQQIQLKSNYSYYGWMGISYRFGSTYNNVVNTRF